MIPPAHAEDAGLLQAQHEQLFCSQPGGPDADAPGAAAESFHITADGGQTFADSDGRVRFNLLGWDGHGRAPHLFPGGSGA